MADRILAALEYLDAHTSLVLQKQKHRSLGDIDAKYDVVDPNDFPLNTVLDNRIVLSGTSRTNLSRGKTIDQILKEDREKILQTAQRARSAASINKSIPHSRPATSLSSANETLNNENRRLGLRPTSHASSSAPRTSTKKLTFTSPGFNVGPTDARDEIMEEIVNKPLTHSPKKAGSLPTRTRTAQSAPALGQHSRLSVGCRSLTSMKRSKTFHSGLKKSESSRKQYETKPGPFTTVKVSQSDMWVVSDSTPTSFFGEENSSSTNSNTISSLSKPGSWEETANSVPREEKKSLPRHERQLGAPPQFGTSQQWYTFAGNDPVKQKPILTAFADKTENEYYSIESRVSEKVASLLQASPGIRIGVNGEVVSKSMQVHKKLKWEDTCPNYSSDSGNEEDLDTSREKQERSMDATDFASMQSDGSDDQSKKSTAGSGASNSEPDKQPVCPEEEANRQYSLLRYLGVAKGENPYVVESASDTTSSGTDVTSLLNNIRKNNKSSNGQNNKHYQESEEAVWKLLEGASPSLWVSKNRWNTMKEERAKRRAKQLAMLGEENHDPLSWKDQLDHDEKCVIEATVKPETDDRNKGKNGTTPVVFHKFVNYDQIPENFVHLTSRGYRPHSSVSAVDPQLNTSPPSKGFQPTVDVSPRVVKLETTNNNVSSRPSITPRPFSVPISSKLEEQNSFEDHTVEVADIMRVGSESLPKLAKESHSLSINDQTQESKLDEVSEEELEAVRLEAAYKMKMTGDMAPESPVRQSGQEEKEKFKSTTTINNKVSGTESLSKRRNAERSVTLSSLPMKAGGTFATVDIRPSKPQSSIPVGALNLSGIDNSIQSHSSSPEYSLLQAQERFNDSHESAALHEAKNGHDAPLNTPKTPHSFPVYFRQGSEPHSPRHDFQSPLSNGHAVNSEPLTHKSTSIKRATKSASFGSRSPVASPRSNVNSLSNNFNLPRESPKSYRTTNGFMASPLTGRPSQKYNEKFANGSVKSPKTIKPGSPSIIPYGNTYSDVIANAGFIQISHSLHIPSQARKNSAGKVPGGKMYDSYMRELSSKSAGQRSDTTFTKEKTSGIYGKSLGGTSGKVLPEHLRHTRPHTTGFSKGSVQVGRRSGLAITNEQNRGPLEGNGAGLSNSQLELQGGQVRLNLDKNIHAIYRDLGIPKKTRKSSVPNSPLLSKSASFEKNNASFVDRRAVNSAGSRSDGIRSHPRSANSDRRNSPSLSGRSHTDSPVVNIPTIPLNQGNAYDASEDLSIKLQDAGSEEALTQKQESNNNLVTGREILNAGIAFERSEDCIETKEVLKLPTRSSDDVVDSGTQWSPHDPSPRKPDLDKLEDSQEHPEEQTTTANRAVNDEAELLNMPSTSEVELPAEITNSEKANHSTSEKIHSTSSDPSDQVDANETEWQEQNMEKQVDKEEENLTETEDKMGPQVKRSASDSKLHLAGKDDADVESTMADEEFDIRGVTKVTVNIASLSDDKSGI